MIMATRFTSSDNKVFVVEEVRQIDRDLWVYYNNAKTGQKYSCLLDAFTQRFQPLENESRVSGH
jgi:selenocysteine lyase/cysteine desulfurase